MHSSRMRTGRSLTVCCSLHPGGGLPAGGVCAWSGGWCAWSGGFSLLGGCLPGPGGWCAWSGGGFSLPGGGLPGPGVGGGVVCLVRGGVPVLRRVLPAGGVSAWSQGGSQENPPVNRITDTCKNITLATTSLRPVITFVIPPLIVHLHCPTPRPISIQCGQNQWEFPSVSV